RGEAVLAGRHADAARPHDRMVVDDHHLDHAVTSVWTVVPAPGAQLMESRPPICSTRAWMAPNPYPGESAPTSKPTPSSRTSTVTTSGRYANRTLTLLAPACLRTLLSASWTTRRST